MSQRPTLASVWGTAAGAAGAPESAQCGSADGPDARGRARRDRDVLQRLDAHMRDTTQHNKAIRRVRPARIVGEFNDKPLDSWFRTPAGRSWLDASAGSPVERLGAESAPPRRDPSSSAAASELAVGVDLGPELVLQRDHVLRRSLASDFGRACPSPGVTGRIEI